MHRAARVRRVGFGRSRWADHVGQNRRDTAAANRCGRRAGSPAAPPLKRRTQAARSSVVRPRPTTR
ncbi:hypothetical protein GLA29479_1091 [Lysobacter antibioticus]|nr:hypothetical protein GLA29479_1091 [Lysobacter antibioticus]